MLLASQGKPGYALRHAVAFGAVERGGGTERSEGDVVNEHLAKRVAGFGTSVFTEMSRPDT